jgi:fused signal recognition particle receptor
LFDKLKSVLKDVSTRLSSKVVYREVSAEEVDEVFDELLPELIDCEIGFDAIEKLRELVKKNLVGRPVRRGLKARDLVIKVLEDSLLKVLGYEYPDLVDIIKSSCRPKNPYVILFLGVNGVGKTTSIAKIAYRLKKTGITPLLVAADTFRAGAQEQLEEHARRLRVPIIKGTYGSDPASVAFDAIEHAKAKNYCAVLIDTAGRMHSDYDLMNELKKIVRVTKPNLKILVVDALTGNDAVTQAEEFDKSVGVDAVIVTKVDADVKGGVIVSVATSIGKPVVYLGVGQGYEDLIKFSPKEFVKKLFES